MQRFWMLCAGAALLLATVGCGGTGTLPGNEFPGGQQAAPADGAGSEINPAVSLEQAQQTAQEQVSGQLWETDLVQESSGALLYAVTIHRPDEPDVLLHTVYIDANTGSVVRVEDRALLPVDGVMISQEAAQRTALSRIDGRVTEATLINLDGRAVWEFEVAGQQGANKVMYVDAQTGEFVKSADLLASHPAPTGAGGATQPSPGTYPE